MTLRVVFFGSPAFAVPSLSALLDAGFAVPLVVTQPDRPVGRRSEPRPTAVAERAAIAGLRVEKPERVKGNAALLSRLKDARPDAIAVVAFGRILPTEILELPRLGCVNVHASLLPKYRGASPIQAAIAAGDAETGVVTMRVAEELDAGALYLRRAVRIGARETAGQLSERLAAAGAELLVETLRGLDSGVLRAEPQRGEPSFCKPIRREDGEVDWTLDAGAILRRLRAFTPWPGLHTFAGAERVKILEAEQARAPAALEAGDYRLDSGRLVVAGGNGTALELMRVQREGRRAVTGVELGRSLPSGRFGRKPR